MANHVYRQFGKDDLFSTKVRAQPYYQFDSGTAGWTGNTILGNNELSLYGGVRSRSDVVSGSGPLQVYPIDDVNTNSIDKVLGIPDQYPQTGSVNLVLCTSQSQLTLLEIDPFGSESQLTDTRWFDEHWVAINILSEWYNKHIYSFYPSLDTLPVSMSLVHVPSMFYGRGIATGSVLVISNAWYEFSGSNVWVNTAPLSGTDYDFYISGTDGVAVDTTSTLVINIFSGTTVNGVASLAGNVVTITTDEGVTDAGDVVRLLNGVGVASATFSLTGSSGSLVVSPTSSYNIFLSGVQYYADDGVGRLNIYTVFEDPLNDEDDYEEALKSGTITDAKRGIGGLVTGSDHRPLVAGYVFYSEGLIVFTHPSGAWHSQSLAQQYADPAPAHMGVRFNGDTLMQSYVFMCRMMPADVNASNNPTFYTTDNTGRRWTYNPGQTYITAVGIYNEERELVAVAKLAQPIRKRDEDNLDIRLRLDIG